MTYPSVEIANKALMRANTSHEVELIVEWFDIDDSCGHVECSCGWKSRDIKVCWLRKVADEHIKESGP